MRNLSVLMLLSALLFGCGDVVDDRYATMADARADQLFERGWLPDVLPASAHDIHTSNNLDLNYSVGEFSYAPDHEGAFLAQLALGAPSLSPFDDWQDIVRDYADRGYVARTLPADGSTWVFFCNSKLARCEYMMWLQRKELPRAFS